MNVEILKSYEANKVGKKIRGENPEGLSEAEIIAIEVDVNGGKKLPKVLREYAYIGGKTNRIGFNAPISKKLYRCLDERLAKRGVKIERPYFVFTANNEGTVYTFIYLDEGDDPQPWNASVDVGYDDDEEDGPSQIIWRCPYKSLSEMINRLVNSALNGLSPW